jgi:hypothetical protein
MTVSATFTVNVAPAGAPIAIVFEPASPKAPDNAPAGYVLAKATVKTSDGTPFVGILVITGDPIFAVNGMQIVLARALTPADDGMHNATITATHPTNPLQARLVLG